MQTLLTGYHRFWQPQYKPQYTLPWSFMTAFWFISPGMCLIIRWYLVRENNRRKQILEADDTSFEEHEKLDTGDQVINISNEDLDQTDRENLKFIYPL